MFCNADLSSVPEYQENALFTIIAVLSQCVLNFLIFKDLTLCYVNHFDF